MKADAIIIGAGIVGLSTAYQVLKRNPGMKVIVLEKESGIARHQTGNNSGVIHSGIYYTPGSAKATNCRKGYSLLLDFCWDNEVPFDLCGKIIIATHESELTYLNKIFENGTANGLDKIKKISSEEIKDIEPYSTGIRGIHVPEAGIVDYKVVSAKMATRIKQMGGEIRTSGRVVAITKNLVIKTNAGDFSGKIIVNCAGLYSDKIAAMTEGKIPFRILPFRGEYYVLKPDRSNLVKGLIYPVPDPEFPFLGVHFTKKIDGSVEAGPNAVLAFRKEGYKKRQIHLGELSTTLAYPGFRKVAKKYWRKGVYEMQRSFSKSSFTNALQKLVPDVKSSDLVKGGAGVRAQACDPDGNLLNDFLFLEREGVIHVCNAPSPAATSGLAIGATIAEKIEKQLNAP